MAVQSNWLDRSIGFLAPRLQLKRTRARIASELVLRHYEGASFGRRTENWRRAATDPNAAVGPSLQRLRDIARDLVRNNPYAESAVATIADHTVGWGITAKPLPANAAVLAAWKAWAESTDCDADGRHDFYGLQKLVMRNVAEAGEVLVRRRFRLPHDGYEIPLQLHILEADFLDTARTLPLPNGGMIVQGVEFDPIGQRVAYWLFPYHPGALIYTRGSVLMPMSRRIPASEILHIGKASRPGQVRYPSWFADVILRLKDFDEYEDATLMKQKIGACLAVITTDADGSGAPLGVADDTKNPGTDLLAPGSIVNIPPGRAVSVVQPPIVREHGEFSRVTLQAIASGLGVTYEDLTGDFSNVNFSSARMARLKHWARVEDWRWRLLVPQFCEPCWDWVMQALQILGQPTTPEAEWSAPPMPMIEPDKEGLAYQRNIRTGIQSWSEAVRERGYDPDDLLREMQDDARKLDAAGLILDSDARKTTQAGQLQGQAATANTAPTNA